MSKTKSSRRYIYAVNFPTKKEAKQAMLQSRAATGKRRGFSRYVRGLITADFNKGSK